ncbi:MAG: hypothetical protein A2X58_02315 [Nitrospirae bacterium GWC2_56_14]|nr:MAG: hypothetical protein A2X83_02835 [Desulfuromonadales bacterium GWD2_54_10]OGW34362.1 MAG: hypothetical protein A2X58_02315 [Nitrospirae bacterium GWC2_56_14]
MILEETKTHIPLQAENSVAKQRILVVDDEPAVLFAYRKLIEREGIGVDISINHQGAMNQVRANQYLAVITDLRLEGTENTDGLKIIHAIREHHPDTKIIMVTGYGNKEIEQMAFASGVNHYFEKPVRPSLILDALKPLIG